MTRRCEAGQSALMGLPPVGSYHHVLSTSAGLSDFTARFPDSSPLIGAWTRKMDHVITHFNRKYNLTDYEVSAGDPRVANWPFMKGLESVMLLTAIYLLAVKYGPAIMANRKPMQTTGLMVVYNFFMVGLSFYMLCEFVACGYYNNFGILCQPVDYSNTTMGLREASVSWWYFFSKIIEFLDTIFFIVRKKNGQISFLHVYHHTTMVFICWYVAKYVPGGEKFYAGGLNVFVHVIMYTYYGLAAMGPQMQKYLWWKRYLTKLQMVQFLTVNTRCMLSLLEECQYPRWINVVATVYSSSLLLLFANFYRQAYRAARTKTDVTLEVSPFKQDRGKDQNNSKTHDD